MTKCGVLFLSVLFGTSALAEKPVGFLWYNVPSLKKSVNAKPGIAFNQLSYTKRDAILRFYTMEALHKAHHTKSIQDMRVFLSLQDYWLNESSRFAKLFQQTLLTFPQYDYTVTHPLSQLGVKLLDRQRQHTRQKLITKLAKTHGLLFFYRGKHPYDQQQIPIIRHFCRRFHLSLIPVSVDGHVISDWPNSRVDNGQAKQLGLHYFPALLLVNPTKDQVLPVSFGLTTQDVLEERLSRAAQILQGKSP